MGTSPTVGTGIEFRGEIPANSYALQLKFPPKIFMDIVIAVAVRRRRTQIQKQKSKHRLPTPKARRIFHHGKDWGAEFGGGRVTLDCCCIFVGVYCVWYSREIVRRLS